MKMIVAVDKNMGIGYKDELLFRNKEDLKHFKETTKNGILLVGRKTHFSMANGKALPSRIHVVLTSNPDKYKKEENVYYVSSMEEALNTLILLETNDSMERDIFVVGGRSIYDMFYEYCVELILTEFEETAENVDVYFNEDYLDNTVPYAMKYLDEGNVKVTYFYIFD